MPARSDATIELSLQHRAELAKVARSRRTPRQRLHPASTEQTNVEHSAFE